MRKIMLLVIAAIVAAGCSSGSSTKTAPVSLSGTVNNKGTGDATSGRLELEADDFYWNPTFFKVQPGESLTLTLKNEGKATHSFTSSALGVDETLQPGTSKDITVTVPADLPAQFHCRFHEGQGMQGAIYVTPGGSVGNAPAANTSPAPPATSSSSYSYGGGGGYN